MPRDGGILALGRRGDVSPREAGSLFLEHGKAKDAPGTAVSHLRPQDHVCVHSNLMLTTTPGSSSALSGTTRRGEELTEKFRYSRYTSIGPPNRVDQSQTAELAEEGGDVMYYGVLI